MDEREELARLIADAVRHMDSASATGPTCPEIGSVAANAVLAAGYRRIPEPGSAEWEAMVDLAHDAANDARPRVSEDYATMAMIEAALRAALGIGDDNERA